MCIFVTERTIVSNSTINLFQIAIVFVVNCIILICYAISIPLCLTKEFCLLYPDTEVGCNINSTCCFLGNGFNVTLHVQTLAKGNVVGTCAVRIDGLGGYGFVDFDGRKVNRVTGLRFNDESDGNGISVGTLGLGVFLFRDGAVAEITVFFYVDSHILCPCRHADHHQQCHTEKPH